MLCDFSRKGDCLHNIFVEAGKILCAPAFLKGIVCRLCTQYIYNLGFYRLSRNFHIDAFCRNFIVEAIILSSKKIFCKQRGSPASIQKTQLLQITHELLRTIIFHGQERVHIQHGAQKGHVQMIKENVKQIKE